MICQVSRLTLKDLIGVIDAYRRVTGEIPDVQLALVGSMATDDPRAEFFNSTMAYADGDPDIHILNNLNNVGAIEGQRLRPVRRGDPEVDPRGLRPLRSPRRSGRRGPSSAATLAASRSRSATASCLVSSPEECAERRSRSSRDPELGRTLGRSGKEHVRRHFLTPRLLRDWLRIFKARA